MCRCWAAVRRWWPRSCRAASARTTPRTWYLSSLCRLRASALDALPPRPALSLNPFIPTLQVPRGSADIFFPSDFELLARLYAHAAAEAVADDCGGAQGGGTIEGGRRAAARVLSTAEFMREVLSPQKLAEAATLGGFNPLVDDFSNTALLLS